MAASQEGLYCRRSVDIQLFCLLEHIHGCLQYIFNNNILHYTVALPYSEQHHTSMLLSYVHW